MSNVARMPASETVVPLPSAPSGAGVDVLALTEDDFFLLAARKVVTLPNRIWHATSETQAADMLVSTPCAVALIDAELVKKQLPASIARLHQQFPDLAFVVAGEPADENTVAPLLTRGDVQGFVVKQHAGRRLASGLESGINRHLELKSETAIHLAQPGWKRPPVLMGIAGGVLAAIALAVVAVFFMGGSKKETSVASLPELAQSTADAGVQQSQAAAETALQDAREAFEAGRYLSSGKTSGAVDHYRAALTIDPINAEAKEGLNRVAEIMLARTELSLVQGDTRAAAESLKSAKAVDPTHPRLEFLDAQISREVARTATAKQEAERVEELNRKLAELSKARPAPAVTPAAAPTPSSRGAAETDRLLALGYERLNQGKLLQPAEDNARDYLLKLKQLQPNHPSLDPALNALRERFFTEAELALDKRNTTLAQNMLDGARSVGGEGPRADKLATTISKTSLQSQLLSTPQAVVPAMIERRIEPSYPTRARRENVQGYVDLRFVAAKDGAVRDVVVVGAQPEGYFEEEAVRAVKRWQIKPRTIDGETYEQLLSLRLRFKLD